MFTIYSDSQVKLKNAVEIAQRLNPVSLEGMVLERSPSYQTV